MGPSGSGKTTLLNTLAQRQKASTSGKIAINGSEQPLSTHREMSAFVEQEDTLIGSLTVRETLEYSAKLSLPRNVIAPLELKNRVHHLLKCFGLQNQSQTLIGTPLQKGLSGGQKRRVSVATQLITSPMILYLDEPTSGLDSTASYEVMSFLRDFARKNNILMIASIHQPSTKTFELFDKVCLLSQGKACFYGSTVNLLSFLQSIDLPVPAMTNPAEHILDITNADFSTQSSSAESQLGRISESWRQSDQARKLEREIQVCEGSGETYLRPSTSAQKPSTIRQVFTLLHRSSTKGYRDLTAYWIRVAMYVGLAIMMGTVWLRLSTDQAHIQPFINAIVRSPVSKSTIPTDKPWFIVLRICFHVVHGCCIRTCVSGGPSNLRQRAVQRPLWPHGIPGLEFSHRLAVPVPHQLAFLGDIVLADQHATNSQRFLHLGHVALPRSCCGRVARGPCR